MAEECVSLVPGIKQLLADKGNDSDAIRALLKDRGKENTPQQESLQRPQRRRALFLQAEGLPAYRNTL
jgi:hypothetical protein